MSSLELVEVGLVEDVATYLHKAVLAQAAAYFLVAQLLEAVYEGRFLLQSQQRGTARVLR